jgi:hypothetical protein
MTAVARKPSIQYGLSRQSSLLPTSSASQALGVARSARLTQLAARGWPLGLRSNPPFVPSRPPHKRGNVIVEEEQALEEDEAAFRPATSSPKFAFGRGTPQTSDEQD